MMGVSGDVAIKGRASGSSHGLSALIPRGRNGRWLWFPIELLFREDPVGRFGQMAGDGPDRLLVAFAPGDALVEASAVAVRRPAAIEGDGAGGFHEGPPEVAGDVGAGPTQDRLPPAGVDPGRPARISRQLLRGGGARGGGHPGRHYHSPGEPPRPP